MTRGGVKVEFYSFFNLGAKGVWVVKALLARKRKVTN